MNAEMKRLDRLQLDFAQFGSHLDIRRSPPKLSKYKCHTRCAMARMISLSDISSTQNEREKESRNEEDRNAQVLFDSGANCCVTNAKEDFNEHFEQIRGNQVIDGIGKGLKICGKGIVTWTFKADN